MAHPPQHSADAEIVFISESDPAWDRRYREEIDALTEAKGSSLEHPMVAYYTGRTRFDLDAPGTIVTGEDDGGPTYGTARPRDYLRPEAVPRTYHLRRMRSLEVARCDDVGGATSALVATSLTLAKIGNGPPGYKLKRKPGVPMTDGQLDELRDAIGMELVYQIGRAAIRASSSPTAEEGKPSGS
jgi:hypothetical protein